MRNKIFVLFVILSNKALDVLRLDVLRVFIII